MKGKLVEKGAYRTRRDVTKIVGPRTLHRLEEVKEGGSRRGVDPTDFLSRRPQGDTLSQGRVGCSQPPEGEM